MQYTLTEFVQVQNTDVYQAKSECDDLFNEFVRNELKACFLRGCQRSGQEQLQGSFRLTRALRKLRCYGVRELQHLRWPKRSLCDTIVCKCGLSLSESQDAVCSCPALRTCSRQSM